MDRTLGVPWSHARDDRHGRVFGACTLTTVSTAKQQAHWAPFEPADRKGISAGRQPLESALATRPSARQRASSGRRPARLERFDYVRTAMTAPG